MSYILASNLVKKYGSGEATVTAISDMNFTISSGEFVGIMGVSGLSLIHISEPTRRACRSRMPSSA